MNKERALEFALTPSASTKAKYIGEFKVLIEQQNPEYDPDFDVNSLDLTQFNNYELGDFVRNSLTETIYVEHTIDWTIIKDIMKMIKNYADELSTSN